MRRIVAAVTAAIALALGGMTVAEPAQAAPVAQVASPNVLAGRTFRVVGHTGAYYANGYSGGILRWVGPKRFFKSTATNDGVEWASGV